MLNGTTSSSTGSRHRVATGRMAAAAGSCSHQCKASHVKYLMQRDLTQDHLPVILPIYMAGAHLSQLPMPRLEAGVALLRCLQVCSGEYELASMHAQRHPVQSLDCSQQALSQPSMMPRGHLGTVLQQQGAAAIRAGCSGSMRPAQACDRVRWQASGTHTWSWARFAAQAGPDVVRSLVSTAGL